ncbi:putative mitochondrial mitochondrial carrier protein (MCP14) [Leptomonas pyrrhocoris]|uniref:Putative mitochondrial mitochondrial carrier protein (MCP14) n=1 Tax=Leptomonas pyrrhocoris TaxID=157538 RepID=A0A0M9FYK3_LEPPY|nr:putative mitochondrial mitochondrial carrier protein (MCP14) [Leptomonas pyrrhocoris]KPA78587.1 putative mitochondrial mitochondrial carrier protein (MCP14) [Leptomonas pyrrhocoris]|eukprot:XP_015657026.1 putative mitochondrial mitochondrial carrier protein (MCP14) [Leptomonas pyrrhocoris]
MEAHSSPTTGAAAAAAAAAAASPPLASDTPIAASPTLPVSASLSTNAVTRNFSDLHAPTWFGLLSANIAARTLLFHPIQLAISRKRVTRESSPPTVWGLMKAAYRGGRTSAYGPACSKGQYDFGKGGARGLYRGVGAALLCNLAGETSYLFTLEAIKEYVTSSTSSGSGNSTSHTDGARSSSTSSSSTQELKSEAPSTFATSSSSAAVGAMCGDLVALLLVSPLVIVCNRQMTAGYSMAASNRYMTIPRTLIAVWGLYQHGTPPASAAAGAGATQATPAPANSISRLYRIRRGFCGLYQGLSAGLLRIPSSGCWWGIYTKSKEAIYTVAAPTLSRWEQEHLERTAAGAATTSDGAAPLAPPASFWQQNWLLSPTDNPLLNALAGVAASVCTTLVFNPIAVIQTRQQSLPPHFWTESAQRANAEGAAGAAASASASASPHHRSWKTSLPFRRVYHVANDLVRKEGLRGFFKGAPANISVAVMDGVVFTLLFEFTKLGSDVQFLEQHGCDSLS